MKKLKEKRKKSIKIRKNLISNFLIAVVLWFGVLSFVHFTKPQGLNIMLFFILLFLSTFITFSFILTNSRRGLLVSLFIISSLLLRYFGLGSIINILISFSIFLVIEIYFSEK